MSQFIFIQIEDHQLGLCSCSDHASSLCRVRRVGGIPAQALAPSSPAISRQNRGYLWCDISPSCSHVRRGRAISSLEANHSATAKAKEWSWNNKQLTPHKAGVIASGASKHSPEVLIDHLPYSTLLVLCRLKTCDFLNSRSANTTRWATRIPPSSVPPSRLHGCTQAARDFSGHAQGPGSRSHRQVPALSDRCSDMR
jgi:hypothetical protein